MMLRLRCIRCGDWHRTDVLDPYMPDLCRSCFSKGLTILNDRSGGPTERRAFYRWCDRYQRNQERHPTYKALSAALDQLEAVPPGTLEEPLPSSES
jgi:hypothetical protein